MSDTLPPEVQNDLETVRRYSGQGAYAKRDEAFDRLRTYITVQAEEIGRLRSAYQNCIDALEKKDAEIERLQDAHVTLDDSYEAERDRYKAETERLRKERPRIPSNGHAMLDLLDEVDRYKAIAQGFGLRLDEAYGAPPGAAFEEAIRDE